MYEAIYFWTFIVLSVLLLRLPTRVNSVSELPKEVKGCSECQRLSVPIVHLLIGDRQRFVLLCHHHHDLMEWIRVWDARD